MHVHAPAIASACHRPLLNLSLGSYATNTWLLAGAWVYVMPHTDASGGQPARRCHNRPPAPAAIHGRCSNSHQRLVSLQIRLFATGPSHGQFLFDYHVHDISSSIRSWLLGFSPSARPFWCLMLDALNCAAPTAANCRLANLENTIYSLPGLTNATNRAGAYSNHE